ncbi:MAG: mechanosensitive ion channel [Bacteroidales bacterium]|nr:mechanosensitive ion channel [Bacteroidales bacterium]MCF8457817.1 mechanosensitive ion channel [Bacteroidales bacterium]
MDIKDLIGYELFESDKYNITVYSLIVSVIIIVITSLLLMFIKKVIKRSTRLNHFDLSRGLTVYQIIKYFIWIIAISLVLETIGVKVTILVAGSAALLVGIGFGLQQIFSDIVSGLIILFDGSLRITDVVEVDGMVGRVLNIGLRTTVVTTRDNVNVIIPNHKFTSENLINWSHLEKKTRFKIDVGVAYGSDVRLVEKLLLECANTIESIETSPKPFVRFNNFGDSSLDFQLYFWTLMSFEVENIKSAIRFAIDDAFRKNGVVIPFPQRDVHMKG